MTVLPARLDLTLLLPGHLARRIVRLVTLVQRGLIRLMTVLSVQPELTLQARAGHVYHVLSGVTRPLPALVHAPPAQPVPRTHQQDKPRRQVVCPVPQGRIVWLVSILPLLVRIVLLEHIPLLRGLVHAQTAQLVPIQPLPRKHRVQSVLHARPASTAMQVRILVTRVPQEVTRLHRALVHALSAQLVNIRPLPVLLLLLPVLIAQ